MSCSSRGRTPAVAMGVRKADHFRAMSRLLPSSSTKPSRLRRLAATLVLVVASLGTVATSDVESPPRSAEHIGQTLHLTREAPTSTHRFVVRITSRDSSGTAYGNVEASVTARWKPADATAPTPPSMRATLSGPGDTTEPGATVRLETPEVPLDVFVAGWVSFNGCKLEGACEVPVELDLEALGDLGAGVIEVDWALRATAHTAADELPEGFTVEILER